MSLAELQEDQVRRRLFDVWDRVVNGTIELQELEKHERVVKMIVLAADADVKFAAAEFARARSVSRLLSLPDGLSGGTIRVLPNGSQDDPELSGGEDNDD
jgi:hypothetical protein